MVLTNLLGGPVTRESGKRSEHSVEIHAGAK
jgi:hypothetical protein